MERLLDWGIEVILWLQRASPTLDPLFKGGTFLGNDEFFLLLLPLIYWCLDRRIGIRVIALYLTSGYLNEVIKELIAQPRPFVYVPALVEPLVEADGYGLPSGHTQNAVTVWGYLALRFRRSWLWVVAVLLMLLLPLSRIYLGVHFPTDVGGGYVVGAVALGVFVLVEPRLFPWLGRQRIAWQLLLVVAVPALMILALQEKGAINAAAVLMGMGVGAILERRYVRFDSAGVWWKRLLRFLIGAAVILGLYMGLSAAFSGFEPALLFRVLRYGLVGLWGGGGAPWVFVKTRLASQT